jgi:hypothetical protein
MDPQAIRLLVGTSFPPAKNAIRRRSMTSIDFASINVFTLDGTAEPTDPAPEQTWILVAVSGSK